MVYPWPHFLTMSMADKIAAYNDAKNEFLAAVDAELSDLTKRQADLKRSLANLLGTKPKRVRPEPVLHAVPPWPPKLVRQTAHDHGDLEELEVAWDGVHQAKSSSEDAQRDESDEPEA